MSQKCHLWKMSPRIRSAVHECPLTRPQKALSDPVFFFSSVFLLFLFRRLYASDILTLAGRGRNGLLKFFTWCEREEGLA